MHCIAAAHIGFACAADKWVSIDGQLNIYTHGSHALFYVCLDNTKPVLSVAVLLCLELGCLELIK